MTARTAKKTKTKTKKKAAKKTAKKKAKKTGAKTTAAKTTVKKKAKVVVKKRTVKKKSTKAPAAKSVAKKKASAAKKVKKTRAAAKPKKPSKRKSTAAERKRLKRFKDLLLEKQQNLARVYNSTKNDSRNVTSDGTEDYIDYAVSSYDRDFMLSLSELERGQLVKIEGALNRIDRGEFGPCLNCGQEIPDKRLEVEPWAPYCVRCQELEEQGLLEERRLEFGFGSDDDDDDDAAAPGAEAAADDDE